jgi:ankyrin repeat protein
MLHKSIFCGVLVAILVSAAPDTKTAAPDTKTIDTRLADAAEEGNRDAVRTLIAQKADVNSAQGDGTTALHWAAYNDDVEMAKLLVAAGASVKATTRVDSLTALFMAAKNGSAPMIEVLIKAGADADFADEHGTTPLMLAAASGSADAVRVLLDHGASVNAREGAHGQTPLMFAAALNRGAAVKVLLDRGADPGYFSKAIKLPKSLQMRNDDGTFMPEEKAGDAKPGDARPGEEKPAGAAAERSGRKGDSKTEADAKAPGAKAAGADGKPAEADLKDMIQKLALKVDAIEKRLTPAAGGAAGGNDDGSGRMFGRRGTLDMGGMTAMMYAARDGQLDAVRALVAGGADINQVTVLEKTSPLVMAAMNGHYEVAKFLVDAGADPNLSNSYGMTALYATIDIEWAPKGWSPTPVTAQEKVTYLQLMDSLLNAGAHPNARLGKKLWYRSSGDHSWVDTAGATAFWRAAQSSDVNAMHLLIKHGADPDIPSANGTTALMVASGIGWGYHYSMNLPDSWMDAVKYCVQLGADVNAVADTGYTALHGAAYVGNHELIKYLMDHGADVKAVAKDKNTVADMANGPTRFGIPHPETVAMLEKLGSANSHNCRSDQCLVNPKEDKKPAAAPAAVTTSVTAKTPAPAAGAAEAPAKKPGETIQ